MNCPGTLWIWHLGAVQQDIPAAWARAHRLTDGSAWCPCRARQRRAPRVSALPLSSSVPIEGWKGAPDILSRSPIGSLDGLTCYIDGRVYCLNQLIM